MAESPVSRPPRTRRHVPADADPASGHAPDVPPEVAPSDADDPAGSDETRLARRLSYGLPIATAVGAIAVAIASSAGPAFLVLAGGALLATIAAVWASLRTLVGDAPVDPMMLIPIAQTGTSNVLERKQRVLRALKDLESERAVGKLDEDDYGLLQTQYRADAKLVLKEIDDALGPKLARAEEIARKHLEKCGLGAVPGDAEPTTKPRLGCPKCSTAYDADAVFCKACGARLCTTDERATADADPRDNDEDDQGGPGSGPEKTQ